MQVREQLCMQASRGGGASTLAEQGRDGGENDTEDQQSKKAANVMICKSQAHELKPTACYIVLMLRGPSGTCTEHLGGHSSSTIL